MDEFEEIGGRCDMTYSCDICGDSEIIYDENGVIYGWVGIYRVREQDVCEFCLKSLLASRPIDICWPEEGF